MKGNGKGRRNGTEIEITIEIGIGTGRETGNEIGTGIVTVTGTETVTVTGTVTAALTKLHAALKEEDGAPLHRPYPTRGADAQRSGKKTCGMWNVLMSVLKEQRCQSFCVVLVFFKV